MNPDKFYNFDLSSLEAMENLLIPSSVCQKCRGINDWRSSYTCSVCSAQEVKDTNRVNDAFVIDDNYKHMKKFIDVFELKIRHYAAKPVVAEMCKNAALYVHFSTYTIDEVMLGFLEEALKNGVQVAGVVGLSEKMNAQISRLNDEYKEICNIIPWQCRYGDRYILPHQKFIIVDGIVGLAGSMNFTNSGFEKHDQNPPFELLWPITDIDTIISVNNEYLSPLFVPEEANNIWYKYVGDAVV